MKKPKKVLVTGGAGFIGSHIIDELLSKKLEVFCIDNLVNGKVENVSKKAKFIKEDILNLKSLKKIFKKEKFSYIFHNAAIVSIRNSVGNFYNDCQTNVMGTLSLLEACKTYPPKRFVFASSMGVYSDSLKRKPLKETDKTVPLSPYGISKITSEHYISLISPQIGMDYIVLRYFNTYGPRQLFSPYVGVITIFSNLLKQGKIPNIYGDGKQYRDFISVKDVARANIVAIKTKNVNNTYNVGTGKPTSVNEIFKMVSRAFAKNIKPIYTERDWTELNYAVADITKAKKLLGFKSKEKLNAEKIRNLFEK